MTPLEDMTEPELRTILDRVASAVKAKLPHHTGFIVLAASLDGRIAQYVSNVERDDAAAWMLETLYRWNRGEHVPR